MHTFYACALSSYPSHFVLGFLCWSASKFWEFRLPGHGLAHRQQWWRLCGGGRRCQRWEGDNGGGYVDGGAMWWVTHGYILTVRRYGFYAGTNDHFSISRKKLTKPTLLFWGWFWQGKLCLAGRRRGCIHVLDEQDGGSGAFVEREELPSQCWWGVIRQVVGKELSVTRTLVQERCGFSVALVQICGSENCLRRKIGSWMLCRCKWTSHCLQQRNGWNSWILLFWPHYLQRRSKGKHMTLSVIQMLTFSPQHYP